MKCLLEFLGKIHPSLESLAKSIYEVGKERHESTAAVRETEPPPRFQALMDFKIQNLWKKKKEEEDPEDVAENARLEKDMELEK